MCVEVGVLGVSYADTEGSSYLRGWRNAPSANGLNHPWHGVSERR